MQIKHAEWLTIPLSGETLYGYDQDWYPTQYKRTRGCGPTTAAMMLSYINCRDGINLPLSVGSIDNARGAMLETWSYFTPTAALGLYSTRLFYAGAQKFARGKGLTYVPKRLSVGTLSFWRPKLPQIATFIQRGLCLDCPVAFLNLHKGSCHQLDSWHWMLIIGLDEQTLGYEATSFDNGQIKKFDLGVWLNTTKLGGGFVYIEQQDSL